jgi:hypothetical protein
LIKSCTEWIGIDGIDPQNHRRDGEQRDRREVLDRVVSGIAVEDRAHAVARDRGEQQRMAIRHRARGERRAIVVPAPGRLSTITC